jgi:predicted HicB family RNase H-like nuclease
MKYGRPSKQTNAKNLMTDNKPIKLFTVAIDRETHDKIKMVAAQKSMSLKEWFLELIGKEIQ